MPTPSARGDVAVVEWPASLRVCAAASGSHVRAFRRHLARWLGGDHLEPDVVDDLVLAASEALENCCDHAYAGGPSGGTMCLTARAVDDTLVITVADDGHWRAAGQEPGHRGRGLEMMRALVDEVEVSAGPDGTQLVLTHHVTR